LKSTLKIIFICLGVSFLFRGICYTQNFSKNSLEFGIGAGISEGRRTMGGGGIISVGYQRNLWKDRLRLNPSLTIGHFSSKHILDISDQWFNSFNLETILYFDLVRIRAFSLTLGAGGVVNNIRGLLGTGGDPPPATDSEYVSNWHFGGYFGGGFRINPKNSPVAIEIMPMNFHVGSDSFMEGFAEIGIDVKLK